MIVLLLFILGVCLGSFAYAMTLRMYDGRDWVSGRSECERCHHILAWYDLIPVISWAMHRGKCHYCSKKIGWSYPLVEIVCGVLFSVSFVLWPYGFETLGIISFGIWLTSLVLLVSLIIFDLKWYILPDKIVYILIGLSFISVINELVHTRSLSVLPGFFISVAIGSGIFYLLYIVSKGRYIGGGDVKFGIYFGILLGSGLKSLLVISIASIIGTVFALPDIIRKKKGMTSQIPFGPSLILATIIMYLVGDRLIEYLSTAYLFP